jgi:hypothetical protein
MKYQPKTMRANILPYDMPRGLCRALIEYNRLRGLVERDNLGCYTLVNLKGISKDLKRLIEGLELISDRSLGISCRKCGVSTAYAIRHRDNFDNLVGLFYFNGNGPIVHEILVKAWLVKRI